MNKTSYRVMILPFLWIAILFLLAGWWLYLILSLGERLDENFSLMVKWEGSIFFILLLFISIRLFLLYLKDQQKTHAWHAFFASLTHELKTPLASMRLQADVISSKISDNDREQKKLLARLIEDAKSLETSMDKILQLSRVEQGEELHLTTIDLKKFTKKTAEKWADDLELSFRGTAAEYPILVDEFALELILRNLMENTKQHAGKKEVEMEFIKQDKLVQLQYRDGGVFKGNPSRLATLFYKHRSARGSGIGLYLMKRLLKKMGGHLHFIFKPSLVFNLYFKRGDCHE